jgi:cytochrome b involved in lipid metabolism
MVTQIQEHNNIQTTPCPLQNEHLDQLKTLVDPMLTCDHHGVVLYVAAREFVHNMTAYGCTCN